MKIHTIPESKPQSAINKEPLCDANNGISSGLADNRPEAIAQRRLIQISRNNIQYQFPVQRKILVNNAPYEGTAQSSKTVKDAIADEYTRYYETEQEVSDHLDHKAPTSFGLIKPRALWYRIPYLGNSFFVFGESHAAVRGELLQQESNIKAPILDEQLKGWEVGKGDASAGNTGVDENSSKLLRALERWNPKAFAAQQANPQPPAAPPPIPQGESSTRDTEKGTYRLVVHGEDGKEEWWKPSDAVAAPASSHNYEAEVINAIQALLVSVYSRDIMTDTMKKYDPKAELAYQYVQNKSWQGKQDVVGIQAGVREVLLRVTRLKVAEEYTKLQATHGASIKAADKVKTGDEYRDEFMLARILDAAKQKSHAFATIGNLHLTALKDRLIQHQIPFITMENFFGEYSRNAIDTRAIAMKNSAAFRTNQRLQLWVNAAFKKYPNLQQMHLDVLTHQDVGEFVLTGKVSKWESDGGNQEEHHQAVQQAFMRDVLKKYPNGEQFLQHLSTEQVGEFTMEGKIAAWET